ncbi:hypothetical protein F4808DRAFT_473134 [Astrocystis sublimbata]|nr:hypothetical protein F4808DRAFT_473134 [Astrocystis sublimbata]
MDLWKHGHGGVTVPLVSPRPIANQTTLDPHGPSIDSSDSHSYTIEDKATLRNRAHWFSDIMLTEGGSRMSRIGPVTWLQNRLSEAADTVLLALNTRPNGRTEPPITFDASSQERLSKFGSHGKTGTSLTGHDVSRSRLQAKICQQIRKNYNEEAKAWFLPFPMLVRLLNRKVVERQLARSDSFLEKKSQNVLERLRFQFPRDNTRPEAIRAQAGIIIGDFDQLSLTNAIRHWNGRSDRDDSVHKKSYLKIMAILILIERPFRIKLFIEEEICDQDLPLVLCEQDPTSAIPRELRKKDSLHVRLKCFEGWSDATVVRFEQSQWSLLAPGFETAKRKDVPHYKFDRKRILPFKSIKNTAQRGGGFSLVRKVEIHRSHHAFTSSKISGQFFAIKELKGSQSQNMFKREVAALKRLSGDAHPYLISLLGTYEIDGTYSLIFPWAEGDLSQYWQQERGLVEKSKKHLRWISKQCQGIAEGLSYIHRLETTSGSSLIDHGFLPAFIQESGMAGPDTHRRATTTKLRLFGLHGDLKPQNILWFPDYSSPIGRMRGLLKITDFGFAEFSIDETMNSRPEDRAINLTYHPPESKLNTDVIGCSYDIWSLGCVYLGFIAWWLSGHDSIVTFFTSRLQRPVDLNPWTDVSYKSDAFFEIALNHKTGHLSANVKQSVTKFLDEMKHSIRRRRIRKFLIGFLELIQDHMLVVENQMNRGSGPHRKSSTNVALALETMRSDQGWIDT